MVDRERQVDTLLNTDLAVSLDNRTRRDGANAEDCGLRAVNDRGEGFDAEGTDVGHRESATTKKVGADRSGDGVSCEALCLSRELLE